MFPVATLPPSLAMRWWYRIAPITSVSWTCPLLVIAKINLVLAGTRTGQNGLRLGKIIRFVAIKIDA